AAAGGRLSDGWGGRVEARGQCVLLPFARVGLGWYGGMGAAWMGGAGPRGEGYLTGLTCIEQASGRPPRWFGEGGAAGRGRAWVGEFAGFLTFLGHAGVILSGCRSKSAAQSNQPHSAKQTMGAAERFRV